MSKPSDPPAVPLPATADQAIARVLAAERNANAAVDECREEARLRLEEARRRTRVIDQRTDARIARLRQRSRRHTAAERTRLEEQARGDGAASITPADESQRIETVIAQLAAELTGGEA